MKYVFYYDLPVGKIGVAEEDGAVTNILLPGDAIPAGVERRETPLLKQAGAQLSEYCAGKRTEFTLPLHFDVGTPFEQSVWEALRAIPYGETCSYADIARAVERPAACRAVGRANGRNPIAIIVPCHRVIGANGTLTGYSGGLAFKEALLRIEGCIL